MNKTREEIQAEVRAEAQKQRRNEMLRRAALWGGATLVLALMVWGLAKLASSPVSTTAGSELQDPVSAEDWSKGSRLSKTVVVEYSDFQCPTCAAFHPVVKALTEKYNGQFLFVYRYYPLSALHKNANLSAAAAEAAGKQGKFWDMHDKLFEHQSEWSESNDARAMFILYAKDLGLDATQFATDLDSPAVAERIKRDVDTGNRALVQGTPTFFINGKQVTNITSYGDLEQQLVSALGASK